MLVGPTLPLTVQQTKYVFTRGKSLLRLTTNLQVQLSCKLTFGLCDLCCGRVHLDSRQVTLGTKQMKQ